MEATCNGNVDRAMKVIVWDHRKTGKHRMMGEFETSMRGLYNAASDPDFAGFHMRRPDTGKEVGYVQVVDASLSGTALDDMNGTPKEEAVTDDAAPKKKKATSAPKAKKIKVSASPSSGTASSAFQSKVINGLRRRQSKHIAWFNQPVSDKQILLDYRAKIPHPMDLTTLAAKGYSRPADFVLQTRRIFANALRFNTSIKDSLRPVAVEALETAEALMQKHVPGFKPLLPYWKLCISILDTMYNLVNPNDGQPTAFFFLHPVSYYTGGQFPPDYKSKVVNPMDFGTVTANLLEGRYTDVSEFARDCNLVLDNCHAYYNGKPHGQVYRDQADRLQAVLTRQLDQLKKHLAKKKVPKPHLILTELAPDPNVLQAIINELRAVQHTDKLTKLTDPIMLPFERPVSTQAFPDYLQFVTSPMDLSTVERKVQDNAYGTWEDFEYDMQLIFRNCETYNGPRSGAEHLVSRGKNAARQFRRILAARIRDGAVGKPMASPEAGPSPVKKIKLSNSGSKGKAAVQRITITNDKKTPPLSAAPSRRTTPLPKPGQPVPLHIAIARIKESFPVRRHVKDLQSWEVDCARYFKELMRHPWISAARPKFIFHVPVPILFPELGVSYAQKIKKPMDLTTVECRLLVGNRYATAEDFVQDVALVFSNAIIFNREGREIGDPLSCAYFDASVHLLKYSRWLSQDLLLQWGSPKSEYVDESENKLPPFSWKLTGGNAKKARQEMEALVLNEPLEKSLERDRYTWTEAECEKLLKSLRHQSDAKAMNVFVHTFYPHDYTSYIAKPMDWEQVNRKLRKRQYNTFGEVIEDLRLIFSNALKYNGRLKDADQGSAVAYTNAQYMSEKLEVAIKKNILSTSDRLERERIDHANAEREIEHHERQEQAKIREAWSKGESLPEPVLVDTKRRRPVSRPQEFEKPFFGGASKQHEASYQELEKMQKELYEKQREQREKMKQMAAGLAASVLSRVANCVAAEHWIQKEQPKDDMMDVEETRDENGESRGSKALAILEKNDRPKVVVAIKPRKTKRPLLLSTTSSLD